MASIQAGNLFNVNGMVFVISGGGSGIGAMMAKALAANGAAKVFITGRRLEKLKEVAAEASNIVPIQGDMSSKDSLAALVEKVKEQTPFVNTIVANHGAQGPNLNDLPKDRTPTLDEMYQHLWKASYEEFTETFNVNVTATLFMLVAFMPLLDAGNNHKSSPTCDSDLKSQFIITGSIGGLSRRPGMGFAYASSKAADMLLMKQVSTMFGPYHIRANVFNPGIFPSDMSAAFMGGKDGSKMGSLPPTLVPLTRTGTAEDIAGVMLFMCSKAGAYVNGCNINLDGGRLGVVPATY